MIKYFSTFSGIAGFELGIGKLGKCIGFSEIDKYACQIYKKHFKHKNYGDITKIDIQKLPDFDLIVGGFPCQSFSIAGKRGGFEDTRGTLFFNIAEIIKVKRPNFVLLENVKGLVSHNQGQTLEIILETLQKLGYYVNIEIHNSKDFGVPQNRERIFILCRHIKTLINTGQSEKLNLSSPIISEYLFQILLNNLTEVQKLQETKSKDWVMGYLLSKEINRTLTDTNQSENTKDGIMIPMVGELFQSKEEGVWQNIDTWLSKNLGDDLKLLNKSTILTAIKQIIESKTYTFQEMQKAILLLIVLSRNSSKDSWKKTLLNLTLVREYTKKYARINDKKEEVIITETGNAYLISDLQDFARYFVTGNLRGTSRPEVFPIGESNQESTREADKQGCSNTLTGRSAGEYNRRGNYIKQIIGGGQGNRVYDPSGVSTTLASQAGGRGAKTGLYAIPVLTPDRPIKRQNGRRFKEDGEPSFTLTGQDKHGVMIDSKIRRLTPKECERLQGFKDGWTEKGIDENGKEVSISDSQRYKVLGNAVTTCVIKKIAKRLLKYYE